MRNRQMSEGNLTNLKRNEEYAKVMAKEINSLGLEEAKEEYESLIAFTKEHNMVESYSWFSYYLAWVYYDMLDLEQAIQLHKEARRVFESINKIEGILFCINGLLGAYSRLQMFNEAIQIGIEGIELAEESRNFELVGIIKSNMLAMYTEMEEYDKGIELYEELKRLAYISDRYNEVVNCMNRSICELGVKNTKEAKKYAISAYEVASEECQSLVPHAISALANVYIELDEYEEARSKLKEAYPYIQSDSNGVAFNCVFTSLGDLELKKKNYKQAIEYYYQVYEKVRKNKWRNELKALCKKLSEAYKGLDDLKSANEYIQEYIKLDEEMRKMISNDKMKILNNKKVEEEEKTYKTLYDQTEKIYRFGQIITSNLQKEDIVDIVANEMKSLVDYDGVQIILFREEKGIFEYALFLEDGLKIDSEPISIESESFAGYCIRNNKEILINDISKEFYKYVDWDKYVKETLSPNEVKCQSNSAIFVPITTKNKVIGALSIQSQQKNRYDVKDLSTMKIIGSFIAIAIENARLYYRLKYFATYDDLTRVLNKRETLQSAEALYEKVKQSESCMSAFMFDIDDFKKVNDTYGHLVGDRVIERVAKTISQLIGNKGIIGRYGGEEFLVFLSYETVDESKKIAEQIRKKIEEIRIFERSNLVGVTVSVGATVTRNYNVPLEQLIVCADDQLYKAKQNGKNRVEVCEYPIECLDKNKQ